MSIGVAAPEDFIRAQILRIAAVEERELIRRKHAVPSDMREEVYVARRKRHRPRRFGAIEALGACCRRYVGQLAS